MGLYAYTYIKSTNDLICVQQPIIQYMTLDLLKSKYNLDGI